MPSITLKNRRIQYHVTNGRSSRYTYFRFRPDATLEIVVPGSTSINVEPAIREREDWIVRQHDKLTRSIRILDRDSVLFDGSRLKVVFEQTRGEESIIPDPERGLVTVRGPAKSTVKEMIRRWFLKESSSYVARALPALARKVGARYSRAEVREVRDWGYCTREGRLSFGWQLIALPEPVREYVLYHELVHLTERNHSVRFRARLSALLPDYRAREEELDRVVPIREEDCLGYN